MGDLGAAQESYQKAQENSVGDDNQLLKLKLANIEMQLAAPATNAAVAKGAANEDPDEKLNNEPGDAE